MATDIRKEVKDIMSRKKFKAGESMESLLATKGPELKQKMLSKTSVPRGTVQNVLDLLKQEQDLDPAFGYFQLLKLLPARVNLSAWIGAVEASFDMSWQQELEQASDEDHQHQAKAMESGESNDEQIRTCNVTLKQILRPDLMDHYRDIVEIAEEKQRTITNTVDELNVLIQKTLLVVSDTVHDYGITMQILNSWFSSTLFYYFDRSHRVFFTRATSLHRVPRIRLILDGCSLRGSPFDRIPVRYSTLRHFQLHFRVKLRQGSRSPSLGTILPIFSRKTTSSFCTRNSSVRVANSIMLQDQAKVIQDRKKQDRWREASTSSGARRQKSLGKHHLQPTFLHPLKE